MNLIKLRICTLITFCCFFLNVANAQNYKLIAKIDTAAKIAKLDNFGNIFIITPTNEVLKFNNLGKFLWRYSNNSFGEISQIDITDPLRVVLFFASHQQIIVLNNNLSEISRYSFNNFTDQQITLVASANNNGFWIYDQINRELKKLSNTFVDELKSGNIYQRNGFDMNANFMLSTDQYTFLNDKNTGIRIFDRFGNYYQTALVNTVKEFTINGNHILYNKDNKLYKYNFLNSNTEQLNTPEGYFNSRYELHLNHLIIINEKGLTLYSIKAN